MPMAPHMVPRMAGIELRVSRPSNWSQCRQRGDSVIEGELVMLDLAASDNLTADYTTTNGKTSLGSRSTASTPLGTVIPATDALAHGRVGVAMGATADNALGLYEFGEIGDGTHGDVIVRALVLSATANAAGVALEVDVSSSIGRFTLKSAGATFATLLEDTGNTGANVLAWVVLHTGGKGGGGAAGEVPAGDEGDVIVLASGGASFEAVTIESILPVSLDDPGTLRGVPTDAGVPTAEAALTTTQVTALINARGAVMETDYNAQSILIAVSDNTPVVDALAEGDIVGRPTGQNIGSYPATDFLTDLGLDGAVSYDTTAWAAGTYQPNVVVEHEGRLYFQGDASATTNVPPASPWVFWGYAGTDGETAVREDVHTISINAQTGTTFTPAITDLDNVVTLSNASPVEITLPQDSSVAYPVGRGFLATWLGVGACSFVAGAGATVNSEASMLDFRARYTSVYFFKRAANTWLATGALA